MSMTINPNMNAGFVNGATGIEPQVIRERLRDMYA